MPLLPGPGALLLAAAAGDTRDRARSLLRGGDFQTSLPKDPVAPSAFELLSAEKARARLGWKPIYSLDDGLAATIRWYRDFLEGGDGSPRG